MKTTQKDLLEHAFATCQGDASSHIRALTKYASQLKQHEVRSPERGQDIMIFFCVLILTDKG